MTDTLTKTIILKGAPETVWRFLTEAEKLGIWYNPAKADLSDGADYVLYDADDPAQNPMVWGRVLTMEPPRLLRTTFCITPFGDNETELTWQLEPVSTGTRLTLTHTGIAAASGDNALHLLSALDAGWDAHFAKLRGTMAE